LTLEEHGGSGLRGAQYAQVVGLSLRGAPEELGAEGRSQNETRVGSIVWSTTASTSVARVSRSIWSRRRVENAWMVVAVS
jgi:hypothetical protein